MKKIKALSFSMALFALGISTFITLSSNSPEIGGGGTGCYITGTYQCANWFGANFGEGKYCDFTGTYGPPIQCTQKECGHATETRHCVQP